MSSLVSSGKQPRLADVGLLDQLIQRMKIQPAQVVELAERAIRREASSAAPQRDVLMKFLVARGDKHSLQTYGRIGAVLRASDVRNFTHWSKSGLHKAKSENRLLAFRLPGQSIDLFPVIQFEPSKNRATVRAWVSTLLSHTGNGTYALHFLTVRRKSLRGKSYAEKLAEANHSETLVAKMLSQASRVASQT